MSVRIGDEAPNFKAQTTQGPDRLPRVDRRRVRGPLLAPEGLHARVHDRARLPRAPGARVREAQHEGDRPQHRSGSRPRALGEGHRGDAGHGARLPDHRRRGPRGREALRHDPSQRGGREAHGRRQRDHPLGLRGRPRQEGQADAHLPDEHRPQLRRGAARHRLDPAHGEAQGGDARELEAGRGRHHRAGGVGRRGAAEVPGRLEGAEAVPADRSRSRSSARRTRTRSRSESVVRRSGSPDVLRSGRRGLAPGPACLQ